MNIHIELLRQSGAVRHLFREHGWRLVKEGAGYSASHPTVSDEPTARNRLWSLGLLTSTAVRIEFGPHAA